LLARSRGRSGEDGDAAGRALGSSDVEPLRLAELLALADDETRGLWEGLALGYTDPAGHPLLRAEIASLHETLEPRHVLVFAGADEAILVAAAALLAPGDQALVVSPCYAGLADAPRAAGAAVTFLPLDEDAGWALDLGALRSSLRRSTRAAVVNFPHNPTGALPSREAFLEAAALCREAGAVLVCDESYRLLEHDDADRLPAGADLGAVGIGGVSKGFGLAGLRIGWLATRDERLLARAAALKACASGCNGAPGELLALIALRARATLLARSRQILLANLARLERFFAERGDRFAWERPAAGSVCFPRLLGGAPAEAFVAGLAAAEGIVLAPGSEYGYAGDRFRLGFGRIGIDAPLARLGRFAAAGARRAA
jgi:aspartate/methionine/tyrosine aminotransferase